MKIAIKGHSNRANEVIRILESLGGINRWDRTGRCTSCAYYIDHVGNIYSFGICGYCGDRKIYTLEEFEKEFPFKVGDIVQTKPCGEPAEVIKLYPNPACIIAYKVRYKSGKEMQYCPENIKFYKEMKEERNITLTLDKAKEWYKKGGELKEVALQAYSEEELTKVELPKTFEEFCKNYPKQPGESYIDTASNIHLYTNETIRRMEFDKNICPSKESAEAHLAMIQLEQLRDCYRGYWKPDWTKADERKYCIVNTEGNITKWVQKTTNKILAFPTPEMRDAFKKNFDPDLEICKELL